MSMLILGLGGSSHDYCACLIEDGRILVAIEEERLSRKKHGITGPIELARCLAADYCLGYVGVTIEDVDAVVGNDILNPAYFHRFRNRIRLFNHHLCHAASALYCSDQRRDTAVLVVDGYGSPESPASTRHETITAYVAADGRLEQILKVAGKVDREGNDPRIENSLGCFYLVVTRAIGFGFMHEGKTMGLAAHGRPRYEAELCRHVRWNDRGEFASTLQGLQDIEDFCKGELRRRTAPFQVRADLAFAAQAILERAMVDIARFVKRTTCAKRLCLAGGVALNGVANWKILQAAGFESIFIQPACGDAGTAIGAALLEWHQAPKSVDEPKRFSPYLGRNYNQAELEAALDSKCEDVQWTKPSDPAAEVAKLLNEQRIVAVFSGRSEIGPRALGNRSILADARSPLMQGILNERVKHRESFRPFAPIVLDSHQLEYFETEHESLYMLLVPPVREAKRTEIPAAVHVDGTGRLQTVSSDSNPHLHSILTAFHRLTGMPVLLNTSFNDNEEPIVERPDDALNALLSLDIDALLLDAFLVVRKV